jgi:hypothetical protein
VPEELFLSHVCQEFPLWGPEEAANEIELDQERGWPLRRILFVRAAERKYFEIQRAEEAGGDLPRDDFAARIFSARTEAHQAKIREVQEKLRQAGKLPTATPGSGEGARTEGDA